MIQKYVRCNIIHKLIYIIYLTMIIVKKPGYLIYKKYIFKCSLGRNGIKKKIKEGDGITPYGTFKLLKIFYRADRICDIKTDLKKIKI